MEVWNVILSLFCCIAQLDAAKILLIPYPFISHIRQGMSIGNGLLDKGHEVHLLTSPTLPELEKVKKSRFNIITYEADEPDFYTSENDFSMTDYLMVAMDIPVIADFRTQVEGFKQLCNNPLKDQELFKTLQNIKFDLAIVDVFPCGRCMLVLMHRLSIPVVAVDTMYEPWLVRNPTLPSSHPFMFADQVNTPHMNFWQRLVNVYSLIDWSAFTNVEYIEDNYLREYFYETDPVPLNKLAGNALLWLIDQTPIMDYPAATMPNEILVGGLSTHPAKPLPPDIEEFMMSNPRGVIVVSFGSTGNDLPDFIFDKFIAAFEKVPYNVIMRYPVETRSRKVDSRIKLMSWLPQNDLLGHKNTILFITHCGAGGQIEGLYHGVPMIGFPMFADQPYNARRSTYHKFGKHMDLRAFRPDELLAAITEVIEDPIYAENIRTASNIFHDQPMTPQEKAVYWIEHVLKYGGKHLRPHALDMEWYEYLMLDIFVFLLVIFLVVVLIMFCVMKVVLSLTKRSGVKDKKE